MLFTLENNKLLSNYICVMFESRILDLELFPKQELVIVNFFKMFISF